MNITGRTSESIKSTRLFRAAAILLALLPVMPATARADGGPVLSDPQLWAQLKEAQQMAVVTLRPDGKVNVDLFISLLDESGDSHQVVYFLPLGFSPSNFKVAEKTSLEFDQTQTRRLDDILRSDAARKADIRWSLLSGAVLINGAWLAPLWYTLILSGCGAPAPEASFETGSSKIGIYGIDEETDLEALINTAGLDPSVRDTLSRLRGQRIAVVTMQTQPAPGTRGTGVRSTGQPGIHLSWTTAMVPGVTAGSYSYPLGTGRSWAHPIAITRVYIVAPPGGGFDVSYPELGADASGFSLKDFWRGVRVPKITEYRDSPAFAVDEASGDFGRIWRATYTQSNSAEDILITSGPASKGAGLLRRTLLGWGSLPSFFIGILVAVLVWLAVWRYSMPFLLGIKYSWREPRLRRDALIYLAVNVVVLLGIAISGPLVIVLSLFLGPLAIAAVVFSLTVLALTLFGVPGVLFLLERRVGSLGVPRRRAALAYVCVILISNVVYLAFALGYAALAGA